MNLNFSLEEKIAQMILVGFNGKHVDENSSIVKDILKNHLGNVWLTDNNNQLDNNFGNIESKNQLKRLIADLQSYSNYKLFISADVEGGNVVRLKEEYGFPKIISPKKLGEIDDLNITQKNSQLIANTLNEVGINLNFAPVVDLNIHNEKNFISKKERCFSSDPLKVFEQAKVFIQEHHKKNIATCLKHFPGHGSSLEDTHEKFVDSTKHWSEKELIPYKLLINENLADAVMVSHVYNKNLDENFPASLSKKIVTDLLRNKMSFNGIILTDDLEMNAIKNNFGFEQTVELAINAGVDILIFSNIKKSNPNLVNNFILTVKKLISKKVISEDRIDKSFHRIFNLKVKLGLKFIGDKTCHN